MLWFCLEREKWWWKKGKAQAFREVPKFCEGPFTPSTLLQRPTELRREGLPTRHMQMCEREPQCQFSLVLSKAAPKQRKGTFSAQNRHYPNCFFPCLGSRWTVMRGNFVQKIAGDEMVKGHLVKWALAHKDLQHNKCARRIFRLDPMGFFSVMGAITFAKLPGIAFQLLFGDAARGKSPFPLMKTPSFSKPLLY